MRFSSEKAATKDVVASGENISYVQGVQEMVTQMIQPLPENPKYLSEMAFLAHKFYLNTIFL
jgi:hypothetical protein